MDKDFTELAVLREEFPNQRVLLCQFHAIKAVRTYLQKAESRVHTAMEQEDMMLLFQGMTHAKTDAKYRENLAFMAHKLAGGESHPFYQYVVKNWDGCADMWASCKRGRAKNLGQDTNNPIETGWRHLKPEMDHRMEMDDCLRELILCEELRAAEYMQKYVDIRTQTNSEYDEEMSELLGQVTKYAAELVFPQYQWAMKVFYLCIVNGSVNRSVVDLFIRLGHYRIRAERSRVDHGR